MYKSPILFLISQAITLFGTQIVQFAIVWFVTLKTSSGIWVALFSICAYLPQFLVSFAGGVWADRYNKKLLIIASDLSIALSTLAMIIMIPFIKSDSVLIYALLVMCIIRSIGSGIQTPAVNAVLPELVSNDKFMRYNGINATLQSIVQFASPAVAGLLLSVFTLKATLYVDIITAIIGVSLFAFVLVPKKEAHETQNSFISDIKLGLKYAIQNKIIGSVLLIFSAFIFFSVPSGYLSGLFVTRNFGNTYWYLTAVELVGFGTMALGGILMTTLKSTINKSTLLKIGFLIFGSMAVFMGLTQNFILYLVLMAIFGVALTIIQTTITTILQENTDSAMHGRIFGFFSSLYSLCYPMGMLIFGTLSDYLALKMIMIASGIVLMGITLFVKK